MWLDTTGRIKNISVSASAPNSYELKFDPFKYPAPEPLTGAESRIDRLLSQLVPAEQLSIRRMLIVSSLSILRDSLKKYYDENRAFHLMDANTKAILYSLRSTGSVYNIDPSRNGEVWLVKTNIANSALLGYYNANKPDSITTYWLRLHNLQRELYEIQDMFNQLRAVGRNAELTARIQSEIRNKYALISAQLHEMPAVIEQINKWMFGWLGFVDNNWHINPLKVVDKSSIAVISDTLALINSIRDIEQLQQKSNFDVSYYYNDIRKKTLQYRLQRLKDYANQAALSEKIQAAFSQYSVISQLQFPSECTYTRFHNAADNLALMDAENMKDDSDIENEDKVCFTVVNIPYNNKIEVEKTSKGFVVVNQATGIISQVLVDNLIFKNEPLDTLATLLTEPSLAQVEFIVNVAIDAIDPYLSYLPPVTSMSFAKTPSYDGYKTRIDAIGPHSNDSSMNNTYTITIRPQDGQEGEPQKASFKYKSYKKSRIQFTTGVHFFVGDAPVVKRVENTNNFKISSDQALRYSAGIKVYCKKQTFSDIKTWPKFLNKFKRSIHAMAAVDLNKPLDNFYFGLGVDIIPGLGFNVGPHLYSYTKYQVHNGQVVGEQKTYRIREGIYMAITLDGSVLNKVFTSFLKIK